MDGPQLLSRLAAGPVVVLAKVTSVNIKARLLVEEALRGAAGSAELVLAYRGVNMGRDAGAPPLRIAEGDRAVFVLGPYTDSQGDAVKEGVYQPAGGYLARIPLPAEGATALLDAIRELVAFQDTDGRDPESTLTGWLATPNPWLIDVALDQAAKLGLGGVEMAPGLLARVADADPRRRARAVEALGTALARGRLERRGAAGRGGEELDFPREAREAIVRLARTDPDPEVRRVAVHQIGTGRLAGAREILTAIGRDDASQDVRYEAAAALARLAEPR